MKRVASKNEMQMVMMMVIAVKWFDNFVGLCFAEWEVLCSSLRSDLDIELSQLREAKDTEILRLKQQLMQKESAMKRMQAEWETKMEAKSQALSDAHKAATQERESLFQVRETLTHRR